MFRYFLLCVLPSVGSAVRVIHSPPRIPFPPSPPALLSGAPRLTPPDDLVTVHDDQIADESFADESFMVIKLRGDAPSQPVPLSDDEPAPSQKQTVSHSLGDDAAGAPPAAPLAINITITDVVVLMVGPKCPFEKH